MASSDLAPLLLIATLAVALAAHAGPPTSDDRFCVRVQQEFAATAIRPEHTLYDDYAAFRASKTAVRPLTTHQFVLREQGVPVRISCKVKTPDHLLAVYGPGAAEDRGLTCRDFNRQTVRAVYASLTAAERARLVIPLREVMLDSDLETVMGSSWVPDYPFAWTGDDDGRLHLLAKTLRVDWQNRWLAWAPERLRGAYYCHLVAPEYLRRLVLGEARAPAWPR
jgi:hypothetical protein